MSVARPPTECPVGVQLLDRHRRRVDDAPAHDARRAGERDEKPNPHVVVRHLVRRLLRLRVDQPLQAGVLHRYGKGDARPTALRVQCHLDATDPWGLLHQGDREAVDEVGYSTACPDVHSSGSREVEHHRGAASDEGALSQQGPTARHASCERPPQFSRSGIREAREHK